MVGRLDFSMGLCPNLPFMLPELLKSDASCPLFQGEFGQEFKDSFDLWVSQDAPAVAAQDHLKHLLLEFLSQKDPKECILGGYEVGFETLPEVFHLPPFRFLTHLNLSGTYLKKVPVTVGKLIHLKHLYLSHNPIQEIPKELFCLIGLKTLDLSFTSIGSLPPELGHLIALKDLYLGGTQIKELPAAIRYLTALEMLHLSKTPLKALPHEILYLTALKELILAYTELEEFQVEICRLSKLEELCFTATAIQSVPPEIGNLTALKKLYLNQTGVRELPSAICHLALERLSLKHSNLESLPPELPKGDIDFTHTPFSKKFRAP